MKRVLRGIIAGLDQSILNDLDHQTVNPSAEKLWRNILRSSARAMTSLPEGSGITVVTVWETDTARAHNIGRGVADESREFLIGSDSRQF